MKKLKNLKGLKEVGGFNQGLRGAIIMSEADYCVFGEGV